MTSKTEETLTGWSTPADPLTLLQQGVAAHSEGRREDAGECYRAVLQLQPENPDALNLLGVLVCDAGRPGEAVSLIRRAVEAKGSVPAYHMNLGVALRDAGHPQESIASLQHAIRLDPGLADAHYALGRALIEVKRHAGAEARFRHTLAMSPGHVDAQKALAQVLKMQGKMQEAEEIYQALLHQRDDVGAAFCNALMLPPIAKSRADIDMWRERYRLGLEELIRRQVLIDDPLTQIGSAGFFLSYHGTDNRQLMQLTAKAVMQACPALEWTAPHCQGWRGPEGRIRIGLISKFLHGHSIGKTAAGFVDQLSRERFEVTALFVPPLVDDTISRFIRDKADRWRLLPNSVVEARETIADLELDVLFYQDVAMDAFTYYLAFARLAPVQCTSFGHPDTTGIPEMDYFVSNDLYERNEAQAHYSERLFLLQNLPTLAYYYRPSPATDVTGREASGLPAGTHLYACPQTLFKLHPDFDEIVLEILRRDPQGVLVLIQPQVEHWLRLLLGRLHARSPSCLEQILVVPELPRDRFLSLLECCDVILDPPQFNGMNSSLEAFAVGAPVVTLPGNSQPSRHTFAMYTCMGITDCVVESKEAYVAKCIAIASDPNLRRRLHDRILDDNGVLFENHKVVREFERFFVASVASRQEAAR
jgi:predicted O-linked N-acetylglucosamine transferase (SPINDLY family)